MSTADGPPAAPRPSGPTVRALQQRSHPRYHYLLSLPPEYDSDPTRRWPLILFLHGGAQGGPGGLNRLKAHGVPRLIAAHTGPEAPHAGRQQPEPVHPDCAALVAEGAITVSPQIDFLRQGYGWRPDDLARLLDELYDDDYKDEGSQGTEPEPDPEPARQGLKVRSQSQPHYQTVHSDSFAWRRSGVNTSPLLRQISLQQMQLPQSQQLFQLVSQKQLHAAPPSHPSSQQPQLCQQLSLASLHIPPAQQLSPSSQVQHLPSLNPVRPRSVSSERRAGQPLSPSNAYGNSGAGSLGAIFGGFSSKHTTGSGYYSTCSGGSVSFGGGWTNGSISGGGISVSGGYGTASGGAAGVAVAYARGDANISYGSCSSRASRRAGSAAVTPWEPVEVEGYEAPLDYPRVVLPLRVDSDRVYVTGMSMGGYGTWALAAAYPRRFAGVVPICGGADPRVVTANALRNLPVWNFHGELDGIIPISASEEIVQALKAGGCDQIRFTRFPLLRHDCWTRTYNSPGVWCWLLQQRRKRPDSAPKPLLQGQQQPDGEPTESATGATRAEGKATPTAIATAAAAPTATAIVTLTAGQSFKEVRRSDKDSAGNESTRTAAAAAGASARPSSVGRGSRFIRGTTPAGAQWPRRGRF